MLHRLLSSSSHCTAQETDYQMTPDQAMRKEKCDAADDICCGRTTPAWTIAPTMKLWLMAAITIGISALMMKPMPLPRLSQTSTLTKKMLETMLSLWQKPKDVSESSEWSYKCKVRGVV